MPSSILLHICCVVLELPRNTLKLKGVAGSPMDPLEYSIMGALNLVDI